ncbi:MAG: sensor histidine kinase [Gammaproteobacteria bacterium]
MTTKKTGRSASTNASPEDWLVGGGEMGKLIRSMDWSKTPLGPIESWPQSLRTTVSLCLASNFPISLAWGPRHVQIYNDGYWPICGGKHPGSMGQAFSECWASPHSVIGDAFERALAGETAYVENQRMFLDRNGYPEETFFTFSFSPIRDETGGVGGLFHPVTETTGRMLSERRTCALRALTAHTGKAQAMQEVFTLAAQSLADSDLDLPFTLFYLLDEDNEQARLIAHTGLAPGTAASPSVLDWNAPRARTWPLPEVVRSGKTQRVDDLEARFGRLACGPYPESPRVALALPIVLPGYKRPAAILLAGVSARLPLDEAYSAFYDLLAASVTSAAANARAHEEERKRANELERANRDLKSFSYSVSHDLRAPLRAIDGFSRIVIEEYAAQLPAEAQRRLAQVREGAERMSALIDGLLEFYRVGRRSLTKRTVDTERILRQCIAELLHEQDGRRVEIEVGALPACEADDTLLKQVFMNLLSNALKYTRTRERAYIQIDCDPQDRDHVFRIRDNGVGFDMRYADKLFGVFQRLHHAEEFEGIGVGLAIVDRLINRHGGRVWADAEQDKGATFYFTLPIAGRPQASV